MFLGTSMEDKLVTEPPSLHSSDNNTSRKKRREHTPLIHPGQCIPPPSMHSFPAELTQSLIQTVKRKQM